VQNHYQLLAVDPAASPEDIKRAFRQEIARYHPDKVQHLGREFQEMAATRAAQLTEAYRTLMNPDLRAEYDELIHGNAPLPPPPDPQAGASHEPARPEAGRAAQPAEEPAPPPDSPPRFSFERATRDEFVRRATISRFRDALTAEIGAFDESQVRGFDVSGVAKSRKLFGLGGTRPHLAARFVPRADRMAVRETWAMAARAGGDICVFLLGGDMAPARELADTITEQRRRRAPGGGHVVMIPVDVRDWHAVVPTDAPPSCKSILKRLREASAT